MDEHVADREQKSRSHHPTVEFHKQCEEIALRSVPRAEDMIQAKK